MIGPFIVEKVTDLKNLFIVHVGIVYLVIIESQLIVFIFNFLNYRRPELLALGF